MTVPKRPRSRSGSSEPANSPGRRSGHAWSRQLRTPSECYLLVSRRPRALRLQGPVRGLGRRVVFRGAGGQHSLRVRDPTRRRDPGSTWPFAVLVGSLPASVEDSTGLIDHYLPLALAVVTFLVAPRPLPGRVHSSEGARTQRAESGCHVRRHGVDLPGRAPPRGCWTSRPTGTVVDTMPILMCVGCGLSMGYEVFVSRMKELHDDRLLHAQLVAGRLQPPAGSSRGCASGEHRAREPRDQRDQRDQRD